MALGTYRKKRNFRVTPEPPPKVGKLKTKGLTFVIQKHAASHLHYDFRLELNGVLLSWAVPKGPSLDPADKRLAMHVEDHPIEYGSFEGIIPKKQYGGGTVLLWDRGTWIPREDPNEGYKRGRLKFELRGEKLKGSWILVRSHGSQYRDKGWLLIKEQDRYASHAPTKSIVDEKPFSVVSKRSIDAIARLDKHVWQSTKSVKQNLRSGALAAPKKITNAVAGKLPGIIEPQLATLVKEVPIGGGWVHEVKFDGYRMLSRIENGRVKIISRNGKDWTQTFSSIADAVLQLPLDNGWLDGEVVVLGTDGRSSFQALQNALSFSKSKAELFYYIFDVPFLNGYDLRNTPLRERKEALKSLLAKPPSRLRYSEHIEGEGRGYFIEACKLKLEGMIAKRSDSPYHAGRDRNWVKVKCGVRQEMVIGGFTEPEGGRSGIGALLLGVNDREGLRYSGKVGTGFDNKTLLALRKRLDPLRQKQSPFFNPPQGAEGRRARWTRPEVVAEIAFTEWTHDGTLRHPSFQGLREDKKPSEVVRERPAVNPDSDDAQKNKTSAPAIKSRPKKLHVNSSKEAIVAGVTITNPSKLLYPEAGISKLEIARFYEAIGEWIVPQVERRPLTLVRCPNGWGSKCFFQKHADEKVSPAIARVAVHDSSGSSDYMMANDVTALVSLLQMGVLEIHPWGSQQGNLDYPDRLVIDFDPDEALPWQELVTAVRSMRALLEKIGLQSFLKTTGGKGLHVVIPIEPTVPWPAAKAFTKGLADLFSRTFPDRYLSTMSKAARRGKIFIDYLRNDANATAIAAYSLRARKNAPVAMPISWDELKKDVRLDHFNVRTAITRLRRQKSDPWGELSTMRQTLDRRMMESVGVSAPIASKTKQRWRKAA